MFRTLILDNFKAFGRKQQIPLAPITLIYGANSSGKSSILQSILLLKQSISDFSSSDALLLPRGELTDLGSFRDFVFGHDLNRRVEISALLSYERRNQRYVRTRFPLSRRPDTETVGGIGLRTSYDIEQQAMKLDSLPIYVSSAEQPIGLWERNIRYDNRSIENWSTFRAPLEPAPATIPVKLTSVNVEHPEWRRGFEEFSSDALPRIKAIIDELVRYFSELQSQGNLEEFLRDSRSAFREADMRRAFGRSAEGSEVPELIWHIAKWYWRGESPSLDDEDSPAITGEYLDPDAQPESEKDGSVEPPHILDFLHRQQERYSDFTLKEFVADIARLSSVRTSVVHKFVFSHSPRLRNRAPDLDSEFVFRLWASLPLSRFQSLFDAGSLSRIFSNHLREALDRTIYLGPLREHPERHYIFSGNASSNVGKSGRSLADVLFSRRELVEATNAKLREFEIGYVLDVRELQDKDTGEAIEDVFSLRLRDSETGILVSLMDVGFGVSQILPVIVQSLMSEDNTILIEQPEIHLHPRLQAELGTLLRDGIESRRRNQFIIETHSEHLMLRIQRLIRRGELSSQDVSVIYVSKDEDGSWCKQLRLDERGDFLDEWPDGFFEEGYREMFAE